MNLALRKPMTLAEFLEWEERQPLRYEFDGVGPVAMAGGSVRHAQIQRNLAFALTARLRGKPCQFLGSDLKIQTEEDHARYPDGIVICSPLTGSETIVDAPVVIFEVLSPSTTHTDRFVKAREYQAHALRAALRHARTGQHQRCRLRPRGRCMDARNHGRRLDSRPA